MSISEMIIRSKIIPPKQQKAIFHRQVLQDKLDQASKSPITIIHAGTGFGKTTTLIELGKYFSHVYWYNITEPDRDPTLFLVHLISAILPSSTPLFERFDKENFQANSDILKILINQLATELEEDAILILDDYHLVSDVKDINRWVEQLIEQRPPRLRIAFACRQIPETPVFIRLRVKGDIQIIDQNDLSFTAAEISTLFTEHYQFSITEDQAQTLYSYTDGWIIALQMIWQRLQASRSKKLENILFELPTALSEVFNFLAQEVLLRQPENVQQFLLSSAVLRLMDANNCNYLLGIQNSQEILQQLLDKALFIFTTDNINFRYQRLFQDFLLKQAKDSTLTLPGLHKKAAAYFYEIRNYEEAVFHLFSDNDLAEAANIIDLVGPKMLELGRLRTLSKWIEKLDEKQLELHPSINLLMGDVLRLRSKFEEAINYYNRAESFYLNSMDLYGRSQALRRKAQVYLDTVRPLKASSLLEEAIRLLEPQEHPELVATLLDQLAENKLNQGKPEEARDLHKEAHMLRSESDPDDIYLEARAMLRTGELHEGRVLLESAMQGKENIPVERPQRFHREMPLLLSLICLMLGDYKKGEFYAQQGIEIGQRLDSPFVEAVGLMRLGHAYQLHPRVAWRKNRLNQAEEYYKKAIDLVRPFNVMRVQVEPLWGLCRFYGYQGKLAEAKKYALQALEIAESSGDFWFVGLINTTLGTSFLLAGESEEAEKLLQKALEVFSNVGDRSGRSTSACALMLNSWRQGKVNAALSRFKEIAPELKEFDQGFLLTQSSFLGIQEDQAYFPLLIEAMRQGIEKEWVVELLMKTDLENVDFHPGYGLGIRCLGPFEVWRGPDLINPKEWQREKARQLFQFFLNNRGKWFTREQIADRLWPSLEADTSAQNLKVAFNALNRALEPDRPLGRNPFFIARRENMYGLNTAARIAVDVDDFIALCDSPREEDKREGLSIYIGDYLGDYAEDFAINDMREQLREKYISTSIDLGKTYFESARIDEAIKISHDILAIDPCNERAFRMLMKCHASRGSRTAVNAVYQRCCSTLKEDMDVTPSEETTKLWKSLTQ